MKSLHKLWSLWFRRSFTIENNIGNSWADGHWFQLTITDVSRIGSYCSRPFFKTWYIIEILYWGNDQWHARAKLIQVSSTKLFATGGRRSALRHDSHGQPPQRRGFQHRHQHREQSDSVTSAHHQKQTLPPAANLRTPGIDISLLLGYIEGQNG